MIIKVELLIDVSDDYLDNCKREARNIPQIILDDIQTHIEYGTDSKIIMAEAYEGTKE
jgi:hypothetical protein